MMWMIFAASAILCYAYIDNGITWKREDVLSLIVYPMAFSGFVPFACLFPMLPYGLRFCDEFNTGYVRMSLTRQGKERYILNKQVATAISGGVTMLGAFGIAFAVALLLGIPTKGDPTNFYNGSIWEPYLTAGGGKLVLLMKLGLAFLFGAVWSSVCLLISTIVTNRYIAYVGSFVLYQLFWVLMDNPFNPVSLLRGDSRRFKAITDPWIIQLSVLILIFVANSITMRRKLENV